MKFYMMQEVNAGEHHHSSEESDIIKGFSQLSW